MAETVGASTDASSGQSAGNGREVKFGRMLESLIEHGGYSRNRKRIASQLGVSVAALSQYIRHQTWPSFSKLLAIAGLFDVSLDYLVYGQPASDSSQIDYGPLYRYVDHALADVQARGSRHTAVVARIGRMLADQIDNVAEELAATAASHEGLMPDGELLRLERYCRQCDLISLNLEFDIIQSEGEPVPGRFLSVVAENLQKGATYRFILPQDRRWDGPVEACRQMLARQIGGDRVRQNCAFRLTAAPVLTGILLYRLDMTKLQADEPALYTQICDYLCDNDWLGCVISPNDDSNSDMLMDAKHVLRARNAFNLMWSSGLPA